MRITFRDTDTAIVRMLNEKGGIAVARAAEGLRKGLESTREAVKENLTGGVLHEFSGELLDSLGFGPTTLTTEYVDVELDVGGASAWYAGILSAGVSHPWIEVTRKGTQGTKKGGGVLAFEIGGEVLFRKTVTHPAMPAKDFFFSALEQTEEQVIDDVRAELEKAMTE